MQKGVVQNQSAPRLYPTRSSLATGQESSSKYSLPLSFEASATLRSVSGQHFSGWAELFRFIPLFPSIFKWRTLCSLPEVHITFGSYNSIYWNFWYKHVTVIARLFWLTTAMWLCDFYALPRSKWRFRVTVRIKFTRSQFGILCLQILSPFTIIWLKKWNAIAYAAWTSTVCERKWFII